MPDSVADNISMDNNICLLQHHQCPICLCPITDDQSITNCKHYFHNKCIYLWYSFRVTRKMVDNFPCPFCRSEINHISIGQICYKRKLELEKESVMIKNSIDQLIEEFRIENLNRKRLPIQCDIP